VVIEATQWFKMGDHPMVHKPITTVELNSEWERRQGLPEGSLGEIKTLEGYLLVTPGDWIITGVKDEHYPCKPDIFELTYELAQPVQEPDLTAVYMSGLYDGKKTRKWVGLTDDDVLQIRENVQIVEGQSLLVSMTIAIEQALKEKNNGT
jgi:hypothetical protein